MEMEFRVKKRAAALLGGLLISQGLFAQTLQYEVWHGHSRPPHVRRAGNFGTLTIDETGVAFEEKYKDGKTPKHPHAWRWDYQEIQQLKIAPKSLSVLTYQDSKWKFGADRQYDFDLLSGQSFEDAYNALKTRLDQRFVAAIADTSSTALWELPAKHLVRFGGDEGVLQIGTGEIVYKSNQKNESRAWRFQDIENIS